MTADRPMGGEPRDPRTVARSFVDPDHDRAVKRGYLRWLSAEPLLDLGCGEGRFLELWRDAGRSGLGVERAPAAVAACRSRGLQVEQRDVFDELDTLAADGRTFGSVLAAHLIEHLPGEDGARLVSSIARVLAPGGRVLLATPNPRSHIVLEETFWLDPTHVRPYPRALLVALCASAGLATVASYDDPATRPPRPAWKQALARLRSWCSGADRSGPMDSVVVAERSAG